MHRLEQQLKPEEVGMGDDELPTQDATRQTLNALQR